MAAFLLLGWMAEGGGTASARNSRAWRVDGKLVGKPRATGDAKKSEDVSGFACATGDLPRVCIAVDDETQGAQIVILKDGELIAGDFIPLISNVFEDEPLELDAEGVTYAAGSFYVIGSHGRPRHEADAKKEAKNVARAEAARHAFRIGLSPDAVDKSTGRIKTTPEIEGSSRLGELIKAQPDLAPWFDKALDENGLTVEGVAAGDGQLYVGMRGPVLPDGNAVVLEVPMTAVFDGQSDDASLHRLDLGKDTLNNARGIRDLITDKDSFLVLAGPVNDPPKGYKIRKGDYTVFSWNGSTLLGKFDLDGYGSEVKPEAIMPLGEKNGKLSALILFDGPEEGLPTPVTIDLRLGR